MGQLDRFRLDGQVALIGGGGGAIGGAMAVALAEAGAKVAVTDISQDLVDATAARIEGGGGECLALAGDMTKRDDADAVVARGRRPLRQARHHGQRHRWWGRQGALRRPGLSRRRVGLDLRHQRALHAGARPRPRSRP